MMHLHKDCYVVVQYHKLKTKKVRPFQIIQKINDNAYVVDLSDDLKIAKTFNVNDLYTYHPSNAIVTLDQHSMASSSFED